MIPEIAPYNNYTGDGATTQFDFDFYIEDATQLVVQHTASDGTITTLTKDTDYSIYEVGNKNGSYITFPLPASTYSTLTSSETISLMLKLPISQQSEYGTSSELDLENVEYSFDYLTRICQILNRLLERAIKVQEGSNIDTDTLSVNLNKVADISSDVSTVAGNTTNINTVSGSISNVNTVAGSISNVNAVGSDIANVNAVKADLTNVDTVAAAIADVIAVSSDISNVDAVATDLTNIDNVAGDLTNIDAVKNNATNINTVAAIASDVSGVAAIASDVTAVNSNASDISDVADDLTNVVAVATDLTKIDAVADDLTKIDAVQADLTNIDAVAGDLTNINAVANDLTNIDNASGYAATAVQYAIGVPTEPSEGSAKYWAGQAAAGQIQADWAQADNTKKDYIKNKPTKLSDFSDDTSINPVDKADTLTSMTATVSEINELHEGTAEKADFIKLHSITASASEINILNGATLSTTELNYVDGVTSSIQNQIDNKANLIWYADRDFEYKQPKFITADKSTIKILAGTAIRLASGEYKYFAADTSYAISAILDTGSVSNGKDYYFYLNNSGSLIASLSETAPSGYNADEVVQIGGAHTLCVAVGSNAPALPSDSFWASHPYSGYSASDFMPNTVWTPAFKSAAKTGNKGQALIEYYGFERFWCDIYLQSGTGTSTASSYSGTITNNRQCILHENDMRLVGKMLPADWQFSIFAEGSNQCTNIAGGAIPSGQLTGGYSDTAGKRMISGFGIECCCGYLWQWGREPSPVGGSGWNAYAVTNRGQNYGTMPYVLLFGGAYDCAADCGSWARACSVGRTIAIAYHGARGVSLHIEKQHS